MRMLHTSLFDLCLGQRQRETAVRQDGWYIDLKGAACGALACHLFAREMLCALGAGLLAPPSPRPRGSQL
jgi:hypothetical protein